MATISDTFSRTVAADSWGTSTSGHVWTAVGTASVNGSIGMHSHSASNATVSVTLGMPAMTNTDMRVEVGCNVTPAGGDVVTYIDTRYVAGNHYRLYLRRKASSNTMTAELALIFGGSFAGALTETASIPSVTAAATVTVRLQVIGEQIRCKVWTTGNAEPAAWLLTAINNQIPSGGLRLSSYLDTGNSNTKPVLVRFDNLTVTEPITAVEQDAWPPRVLVSVTGLSVGDSLQLFRVVDGERTAVRGGASSSVTDSSFLRTDAELPFGVPVSYMAVVNDSGEYSTTAVTYSLPGGQVAITDAVSGEAVEVKIRSWDNRQWSRQASTFKVGGRTVVVSGDLGMFEADVEVYVETTEALKSLMGLLRRATEGVIQIRQAGSFDGVDSYLAILGVNEKRVTARAEAPQRAVSLRVAEVEGWAPFLEARGTTLQNLDDAYNGLTLANIAAGFPTLLAIAQEEF